MILKRTLIIIGIIIITTLIGAGLLLLGNRNSINNKEYDNGLGGNAEEYSKVISITDENIALAEDDSISNNQGGENINNTEKQSESSNSSLNTLQNGTATQVKTENNTKNTTKQQIENKKTEENNRQAKQETKEDVYTFKRNDTEIQRMINIAKRIIRENKNNRCSGLVDKVNSINFIIGKAGNVFYPLFDYRIENIVIDNYYPEFYVYAEDIYKNGEFLRTEYYFN